MTEESRQIQALARMVAEHMAGWTYQPAITNTRTAIISMSESNAKTPSASIAMFFTHDDKRLFVIGRYLKYKDFEYPLIRYDKYRPSINVSANKTPEQIAKDISMGLLPQYLKEYEEGLRLVRKRTENDQKATSIASELQALHPGSDLFVRTNTYSGETTVDIHLHGLPLKTAKEMLRALTTSNQEELYDQKTI